MESQSKWTAKLAFIYYLTFIGGGVIGALFFQIILLALKIDILDFPISLLLSPVLEAIYFLEVILFAKYKGAGFRELGLKRANLKVLIIVSFLAFPILLLNLPINLFQETVFGPDPMAELIGETLLPRNPFQLAVMIAIFLFLVGPIEELAFRGFIQKGFENSFGKTKGLWIASALFGITHGLNTPYAILPAFVIGLCFGYVWQRTGGNTTASALIHGVYNSISIILSYFLLS